MLTYPLFLGSLGFWEIFLIVLVIVLLFGGKKIPELMSGLGKGVRSFKDGMEGKDGKQTTGDKPSEKVEESKAE